MTSGYNLQRPWMFQVMPCSRAFGKKRVFDLWTATQSAIKHVMEGILRGLPKQKQKTETNIINRQAPYREWKPAACFHYILDSLIKQWHKTTWVAYITKIRDTIFHFRQLCTANIFIFNRFLHSCLVLKMHRSQVVNVFVQHNIHDFIRPTFCCYRTLYGSNGYNEWTVQVRAAWPVLNITLRLHQNFVLGWWIHHIWFIIIFVQKTFHPYALSWNHIFVKKEPTRIENCLPIEIFKKNFHLHKNKFWSVYGHTKPNNLWAKSTILSSTQQLFSHQYGGFGASYPGIFRICAVSLQMQRNFSWVEQGRKTKLNVAAVEFAGWWNGISCCLCPQRAL